MLKVEKINVFYNGHQALFDVSVKIRDGEIISLIGANGAGKTTFLNAVISIISFSSGRILLDDKDISILQPHEIIDLGIALVPEERRLFSDMTVRENLFLGSYLNRARKEEKKTIEEVYNYFPVLAERKNQLSRTLSGGEQQMLAIGRALMSRPRFLLLDEPSLGLSPIMVQKLFQVISEINKNNVGILLVEQNAMASMEISKRTYVIETGKVIAEGESVELLKNEQIRKAYLGL